MAGESQKRKPPALYAWKVTRFTVVSSAPLDGVVRNYVWVFNFLYLYSKWNIHTIEIVFVLSVSDVQAPLGTQRTIAGLLRTIWSWFLSGVECT